MIQEVDYSAYSFQELTKNSKTTDSVWKKTRFHIVMKGNDV